MSTKVKGIFKGFKCITQIFEEREEEMKIGLPTDVKHLAHIGIDGQSAKTPSWMNDFGNNETLSGSKEDHVNGISAGIQNSLELDVNDSKKSRRKSSSKNSSPLGSPKGRPADAPKPRRHHRSSDRDSQDSSSSGKGRRIRRHTNNGHESQELPSLPKHSQRRKSKGGSNDGSSKSRSSSKGQNSLTEDQYTFSDFGSAGGSGHILSKENEHVAMAISA